MFLKKERSFQIKIAYLVSRIFEPFAWLALFLQGKRRRVRIVPLPDGNSKKKTITTRNWQGVRGIWRNRHYRAWLGIWVLTVLVFVVLVFGEVLVRRLEIAAGTLGTRTDKIAQTQLP